MIEQQYYTRERRGVFRPSEGYDTIARSKGLSDNFIKKYLHPFCFYDPPRGSGRESEKYPPAFMCFITESGEMVLGRTVYKSADFTGLRSTYFTHNLVIPPDEKDEFIRDMDRAIFASGFDEGYNIENGKELPGLTYIGRESSDISDGLSMLEKAGMTEELYKKLLYSAIVSAGGKRNIYISLNADVGEISFYAKTVLKYLLNALPYEVRENTGYITYVRDPESRRYVNIMFIEDEGLKAGRLKVEKEYVFDLAQGKTANVDPAAANHIFSEYVFLHIDSLTGLQSLFEFISKMIQGAGQDVKFRPETYDELCILYLLSCGEFNLYNQNREAVHEYIIKYYPLANTEGKTILNNICIKLAGIEIDEMRSVNSYLPSYGILNSMVSYFSFEEESVNSRIIDLNLLCMYLSHKTSKVEYINGAFSIAMKSKSFIARLSERMTSTEMTIPVFNNYLDIRFLNIDTLNALSGEIALWSDFYEGLLSYGHFKKLVSDTVIRILDSSSNFITEGNNINRYLVTLSGLHGSMVKGFSEFASSVSMMIDEYIYSRLDIDSITFEDLQNLQLRMVKNEPKYRMLELVNSLVNGTEIKRSHMGIFREECADRLKVMMRRIYEGHMEYKNYPGIILSFIDDPYSLSYDYKSLFEYLSSKSKYEVYEFLIYSFKEDVFSDQNGRYSRAVKQYFKSADSDAFKSREIRKKLYSSGSRELTSLLKKIEYELSNPIKRIIMRHKMKIIIAVPVLILAFAAAFFGEKLYYTVFPKAQVQTPSGMYNGIHGRPLEAPDFGDEISPSDRLEGILKDKIDTFADPKFIKECRYAITCTVKDAKGVRPPVTVKISCEAAAAAPNGGNSSTGSITVKPKEYKDYSIGDSSYKLDYSIAIQKNTGSKITNTQLASLQANMEKAIGSGALEFVDSLAAGPNADRGGN